MKIYFVRHGESGANATRTASKDTTELTELGREQVYEAVHLLRGKGITKLLTSPLVRTRQTAEIIASELGRVEVLVLDTLAERNLGDYKGQPRPEDKNFFYEFVDGNGVEARQKLMERTKAALEEISSVAHGTDGKVLVVGHAISGFFMRNMARGTFGYDDFDWSLKIDNAEVVEVEINKN